jgi:hypothetical protein
LLVQKKKIRNVLSKGDKVGSIIMNFQTYLITVE